MILIYLLMYLYFFLLSTKKYTIQFELVYNRLILADKYNVLIIFEIINVRYHDSVKLLILYIQYIFIIEKELDLKKKQL